MRYRTFAGTNISEIGLGTWQLGNADWGNVDENEASNILQTFVDAGGNFIDTADVYGMGISEKMIGKFLELTDKDVYVATKLGRRQDNGYGWPQNFSYDFLRKQVESSLTNLGIAQLFLEQLHCIPTDELRSGKVFDQLRKLQDEQLIKHWGVSVETTEEALICLDQEGLTSLQIIFNLFRQHIADELFTKARERNVSLIVRVPLASGLLTGKFNETTAFNANDHRNFNANGESFNAGETFAGVDFREGVKFAQEISGLMPDNRVAQWSIRWILDHPEVTTVIPGASRASQVTSNVEASDLPKLPSETRHQLRKIYEEKIKPGIRGHY